MRAARYPTSGPDEGTLSVVEMPQPTPAAGEVLVRVRFSGVNPTDWKSRQSGGNAGVADAVVPNQDGAGEIVAVGEGVDPGRVGERVWLWEGQWQRAQGTAAPWIALPAEQAVTLPNDVPLELGAGLGIPAITAHRCLFADGPLDGTPVLVARRSRSRGPRRDRARPLARRARGHDGELRREGRAGPRRGRRAGRQLPNEPAAERLREWAPDGVARIVEVNLPANIALDTEVIADGGVISCYVTADRPVELPRALMQRNARIAFVLVYTTPIEAKRAAISDIAAALRDGALTALPEHRFSLDEIAAAHDAVQSGVTGKVLVELP